MEIRVINYSVQVPCEVSIFLQLFLFQSFYLLLHLLSRELARRPFRVGSPLREQKLEAACLWLDILERR